MQTPIRHKFATKQPIEPTSPECQELVNTVFGISRFARRKDKQINKTNQLTTQQLIEPARSKRQELVNTVF